MKQMRWVTTCGIFAGVLLANAGVDAAGRGDEPKVIEIHSKKFAYEPADITVVRGVPYRLHLTSDDVVHSLRIKALGLSGPMKPGEFSDVSFTPNQTGDFKADCGVYCGVGHTKMFLTVHVVEK